MADADAELPWGEDAAGRLVSAAQTPQGIGCGCVCPNCRRPLVAHQGAVRVWHFQHVPAPGQPGSCAGYLETSLHKLAKQVIAEAGELWLPELVARHQHYRETVSPARRVGISNARMEPHLGQIKPDLIVTSGGRDLIVEVAVTHKAEPAKLAWLAEREHPAIELDLSGGRDMASDALPRFILREARRIWLWHREQAVADAAYAERIAAKLAAQRAAAERREAEWQAKRAAEQARIERLAREADARRAAAETQRQQQLAEQRAETERWHAAQAERDRIENAARDAEQAARDAESKATYDAMVAIERARIRKQMTGEISLAESLAAANRDAERRAKRNAELFGPDWQRPRR